MTAQYLYSSAKRNAALAAIGGDAIGQIEVDLLKQVLVATVASGGGGGGAAAWGSITGTLSAQTDLQTALDAKLDLTGGTVTGQLVLTGASATGALNLAPTWNNAGTDFNLIYGRVTNTASGAGSKLIDIGTVAGGSKLALGKAGNLVLDADSAFTGNLWEAKTGGATQAWLTWYGQLSATYIKAIDFVKADGWLVIGGLNNVYLGQQGNGRLLITGYLSTDPLYEVCLGPTHATTGTTVTVKAGDVTTGTGSSLTVESGVGSVANGVVNICKDYNSPLGFFNSRSATQANTGITGATQDTGTIGAQVLSDDTFDGYTLAQVVAAVRSYGLLA